MIYADRSDAGRQLAELLSEYHVQEPIVLALPRGGVVVGFEVARTLEAPLDVVAVRKLGVPEQPELGFGAIASGGYQYLDETAIRKMGLTPDQVDRVLYAETMELLRREEIYRGGRAELDLTGRTVILVDDGLATGATARVAIEAIRRRRAKWTVLAVPVAPPDVVHRLAREVDDLVCQTQPPNFRALSQWYQRFDQTTDGEVLELLDRARQATPNPGRPD